MNIIMITKTTEESEANKDESFIFNKYNLN